MSIYLMRVSEVVFGVKQCVVVSVCSCDSGECVSSCEGFIPRSTVFQEHHRASLVQCLTSGQFPTITYPLLASFILFGLKDNDCLVNRIIFVLCFILICDFQDLVTWKKTLNSTGEGGRVMAEPVMHVPLDFRTWLFNCYYTIVLHNRFERCWLIFYHSSSDIGLY